MIIDSMLKNKYRWNKGYISFIPLLYTIKTNINDSRLFKEI
ncbi:hypothetical protein IWQ47_003065 [Aquimarina sp. EL_43]|nr:hypothetical protein [Aquimarina sp. EL_35]MBG6152076.1 hypothetical protein [Aquimarina sp. EL_32]MBG6169980.1 hypothetical protein [Aquimarina sp. EL_43]